MTRATTTTLAVAADYADAMIAARRAKSWLFLILLLILLLQVGIFVLARFVPAIHITADVTTTSTAGAPSTQSTEFAVLERSTGHGNLNDNRLLSPLFQYLIAGTDFLGVTLTMVLAVMLLLILTIMLVGRLVGVAHVTSAFVWCIVLLLLLFPWQTLLNSNAQWIRFTHDVQANHAGDLSEVNASAANAFIAAGVAERADQLPTPDVRIPGVLYTWGELERDHSFSNADWKLSALKWTRYVGMPVVAILILMGVQARSSRGLKFALGESEMRVEVTSPVA